MHTPIFESLSAWTFALLPALGIGRPEDEPRKRELPQREKAIRLPTESGDAAWSLFLPAGPGPHPALLLDGNDAGANLRAEAHRFASIGVAAFFRERDRASTADPLADAVARADYLRDRLDINPFEVGALCAGEPVSGWLETLALRGAAFLIRVSLRPAGPPFHGIARESEGPRGAPLLDVLAPESPLGPEVTRLVDAWLLRQVTIRA